MTEELKIVIKAATDAAQKEVKKVSDALGKVGETAKGASGKVGTAMKAVGKSALAVVGAVAAVATAVIAAGAAMVKLGKDTLGLQKEQAKLATAFQAAGSTAEQAAETYSGLYRFLGDSGKATEAASHLAKITTNQQDLAEWTKITQGIYATFGDSLPIEGLTEAANETIRVGQVTGTLADALNWAGVSEDEFNAKLAQTTSYEEREALVRGTLNGLYEDAADIYERNNGALLDYNESQANLDVTMASAGQAVLPLMTALNNLSATFFTALKPALDAIVPPMAAFVDWITKGIQAVLSFFGVISGKSSTVKTVSTGLGAAADSAKNLGSGLGSAQKAADGTAKAAEAARKSTMGFDELNVVSSGSSASGSSGGVSGASGGGSGYAAGGIGGGMSFGAEIAEGEESASGFAQLLEKIKPILGDIKNTLAETFAPAIGGFKEAWESIKSGFVESVPYFQDGLKSVGSGLYDLALLYADYYLDVFNSFGENIAPIAGDIIGFAAVEVGKTFAWLGETFQLLVGEVITPAVELIKTIVTGTFGALKAAWDEYGQPLMDAIGELLETVRGHIDNILNSVILPIWNTIMEVLNDVWTNGLEPMVQKVISAVLSIATEITVFYNKVLAPIIDWIITKLLPPIVNVLNSLVKTVGNIIKNIANIIGGVVDVIKGIIQFIVGVFTRDWDKAWEGIKNIFGGVFDTIGGAVKLVIDLFKDIINHIKTVFVSNWEIAWETVKGVFLAVWDWIKGAALDAWEGIKNVFSGVSSFFTGLWQKVKDIFNNVKTWFKDKFQQAWDGIKNVFSGVSTFFSGVWDKIKGIFSKVGSTIASAITNTVKSAINSVLSTAISIINGFISAINIAIGIINAIPGVNIKKLTKLSVPKLAEGGIVDGATLAMIGENGKEAVVPLENNTEWMDKFIERLATRLNNPTKVILKVGEKELGWATINAINGITEQTGGLQLAL